MIRYLPSFLLPIAIVLTCISGTEVNRNNRVSFSAKILSVNEERNELNTNSLIDIEGAVKNETKDTIILLTDVCYPGCVLTTDNKLMNHPLIPMCYLDRVGKLIVAPDSIQHFEAMFSIHKSIKKLHGLKFRVSYNFQSIDMFSEKEMELNDIKELFPKMEVFANARNPIWSDTLEIK